MKTCNPMIFKMPEAGIEPAQRQAPRDFKDFGNAVFYQFSFNFTLFIIKNSADLVQSIANYSKNKRRSTFGSGAFFCLKKYS